MQLDSILLTAGFSSRMKKDKALIKFNNEYFINIIISKLLNISDNVFVVLGYHKEEIKSKIKEEYLEKIKTIYNENYKQGMYSSIKKAMNYTKNNVLLQMIDQPFLPKSFYIDFANNFDDSYYISQPIKDNKLAHPIILNKNITKNIINDNNNSLREYLKPYKNKLLAFKTSEESIFHNINNKEILEKIIK